MVLCHFGHFYIAQRLTFELCMLGFWNFIYGFLMKKQKKKKKKKKKKKIADTSCQGYVPFLRYGP